MEPAPGLEPGTCRLRRNRSRQARHGLRVHAGTGEGYEFLGFPGVSRSRNFRGPRRGHATTRSQAKFAIYVSG